MRKIGVLFLSIFLLGLIFIVPSFLYFEKDLWEAQKRVYYPEPSRNSFEFQAIDTMKYSRDLSREKLNDSTFDKTIEEQVKNIAQTGATHIAIATPYDEEFLPMLRRWVEISRNHNLKVWFRGNWSGWEGWFEYPKITREEHLSKTEEFIVKNADIFEDGDAFSSCPECENGGDGDPRQTGDTEGYRRFLIDEYDLMNASFEKIDKKVQTNLFSMNGDVAKMIMDKSTTTALGGVVTIDHYVDTPEKLIEDVDFLAQKSGGKVILGEFGAPIPDIHGEMSEKQQAEWIDKLLGGLQGNKALVGASYWLNVGGSTEIWKENGKPKEAVETLSKYYKVNVVYGSIYNEIGELIEGVSVEYGNQKIITNNDGYYELKFVGDQRDTYLKVSAPGYFSQEIKLKEGANALDIDLIEENKNLRVRFILFVRDFLR